MTNMEHYRDRIEATGYDFGIHNGTFKRCGEHGCKTCDFYKGYSCVVQKVEWLMAEHKEPVTLTAREKHLVECLSGDFIARDKNGALFWYQKKPLKGWETWDRQTGTAYSKLWHAMFGDPFPFIKWEDEEPWSVEELRKLPALEYNPELMEGGAE